MRRGDAEVAAMRTNRSRGDRINGRCQERGGGGSERREPIHRETECMHGYQLAQFKVLNLCVECFQAEMSVGS